MAWKGYDFFPHDTKIDFMRWKAICLGLSLAMMLGSIALFFTPGLKYGVDFKGGSLIEVKAKSGQPIDISSLRSIVGELGVGETQVQAFGSESEALIRLESQPGGEEAQQKAVERAIKAVGDSYEVRRTEVVGPTMSEELKQTGILAVLVSILAIVAYVWFRFEWQFAAGVVIALFHDVLLTIGLFAILQLQFDLTVIAALLTIIGYSVNDSVVVSDRIRENLRKFKKMPLHDLLNLSVNETLSRTILTGGTTFAVLLALYFWGGEVIRPFVLAMLWGILVGTYSSIFVAAPVLEYFGVKRDWSAEAAKNKRDAMPARFAAAGSSAAAASDNGSNSDSDSNAAALPAGAVAASAKAAPTAATVAAKPVASGAQAAAGKPGKPFKAAKPQGKSRPPGGSKAKA